MKEIFLNETDVLRLVCSLLSWGQCKDEMTFSEAQLSFVFNRRVEHKNLLTVLGQATEQEPYLIIFEHTPVVSYDYYIP